MPSTPTKMRKELDLNILTKIAGHEDAVPKI